MGSHISRCLKQPTSTLASTSHSNSESINENLNFTINCLPEEVIVEIFTYLNLNDLKTLCQACKLFLDIISNNYKLFQKFPMIFNENCGFIELKFRKPQNVKLTDEGIGQFIRIRSEIGILVRILTINCRKCEILELKKILDSCENLKELTLEIKELNGNLDEYEDFDETWMDVYNHKAIKLLHTQNIDLKKLSIAFDLRVLKLLKNYQTKEFIICKNLTLKFNKKLLEHFLENQKILKSLDLKFFKSSDFFASSNFLNAHKFRLEKFTFMHCGEEFTENIPNFLKFHKYTLNFIKTDKIEKNLIQSFKQIENLKTIEFNFEGIPEKFLSFEIFPTVPKFRENSFKNLPILYQVENLKIIDTISGFFTDRQNLMRIFPNIQSLSITDGPKIINIENCRNLKFLKIEYDSIEIPIKIPKNLEKVELFVSFYHVDPPFNYDGNEIVELTLKGASNLNWIEKFLENPSTNLKFLKIIDSSVDVHMLNNFKHKVDKLMICGKI